MFLVNSDLRLHYEYLVKSRPASVSLASHSDQMGYDNCGYLLRKLASLQLCYFSVSPYRFGRHKQ